MTVTGLIIFGGIGYQVIFQLYLWGRDRLQQKPGKILFTLDFKVATSTTLILLAIGTVAFLLIELRNPATFASLSLKDKLFAAWFQSVTPRTAGFNTIDIGKMRKIQYIP